MFIIKLRPTMVDFYPVITEDGTLSLFNTKINDIYHSKIGAYTEALNKFVLPSEIVEYAQSHDNIRILDICFGLGYNTRVAINEIWKVNPKCRIHVTGIEIDPNVLACSYYVNFDGEDPQCRNVLKRLLLSNPLTRGILLNLHKDVNFNFTSTQNISPFKKLSRKRQVKYYITTPETSFLHNIYYGSVSHRNKNERIIKYCNDLLDIDLCICDVRTIICELKGPYNYIFHDPFTPSILPSLWTADLFGEIHRMLDDNGNLTTYTSSSAVRSGMIEAGFSIGTTNPVGRKSSGTIAYKDAKFIVTPLDKNECGLLDTNAGIPYYDEELKLTDDKILDNRENMIKQSERISTSQYIKSTR